MKRPHQMSRPQSRVGFGQGREVSRTARHNIPANASRLGEFSFEVQVIRHTKIKSYSQGGGLAVLEESAGLEMQRRSAASASDIDEARGSIIRSCYNDAWRWE